MNRYYASVEILFPPDRDLDSAEVFSQALSRTEFALTKNVEFV